ncbi:MAG: bile acid:sodium symporter [Planctomycetota bacterium]|jgi:predicted Na+-dependent transporter
MGKKLFLPVGIIIAVVAALLAPSLGRWLKAHHAVYAMVVGIFLVNGWRFKVGEMRFDRRLGTLILAGAVLSLGLGPVLVSALVWMLGLQGEMAMGLFVIASMPTTLSSAIVITTAYGGNGPWALLFTISLNLLAIFTIPILLPFFLGIEGGVEIDSVNLLAKMALLVLLPFAVGYGLQRVIALNETVASYAPSLMVILLVYAAFSNSSAILNTLDPSHLPLLLICVLFLHGVLLALSRQLGRGYGLERPELIAVMLCVAQKTLPMAISVLAAIGIGDGLVIIPCLAYYFVQLTLDPLLIATMTAKAES